MAKNYTNVKISDALETLEDFAKNKGEDLQELISDRYTNLRKVVESTGDAGPETWFAPAKSTE